MLITTILLILLPLTTAMKWYLDTYKRCTHTQWVFRCAIEAKLHTDRGVFEVNAEDGCRVPPVPGVHWMCIDWYNKRAHFNKTNSRDKSCLVQLPILSCKTKRYSKSWCFRNIWTEEPCTW
ncbi:hypothetical protein CDD80_4213 [Ophiocordyceps camponoti-rufipedis]|uniref:Secreted protein n=1 Tax=Ophiocordyceps camponoti-rufipedis TaxID=2004952 RepID=A0A2C5YZB3_9HYPO|nr:hypothetical protein CDD80_4213 [Ophiocordyceps camponoti-rufipedis]